MYPGMLALVVALCTVAIVTGVVLRSLTIDGEYTAALSIQTCGKWRKRRGRSPIPRPDKLISTCTKNALNFSDPEMERDFGAADREITQTSLRGNKSFAVPRRFRVGTTPP